MKKPASHNAEHPQPPAVEPQPKRADAQRKMAAVLQAATEIFAASGVDAPVRDIAEKASVGLGTVYRHFPSVPI